MLRKKIDWEAIEADYRVGYISVNQLAKNHGIIEGAIRKKAQKGNWPKDLSAKIKAAADRKVLIAQNNKVRNTDEVRTILFEDNEIALVDRASTLQAEKIEEHIKSLEELHSMAEKLGSKFSVMIDSAADSKDIASATQTFKSYVETQGRIITLDRQVYNIEDKSEKSDTFEDWLRKARNA